MPKIFGLTEHGFKAKAMSDIKGEIEAKFRSEIDPTLAFGHDSVAGIITAIVAHQARQVWESLSGLYHSLQPNTASGRALDALCSLTGTYREKAACSKAIALATLDVQAKLPKDTLLQTISGHLFKVTGEVANTTPNKKDVEVDLIAQEPGPIIAHLDTAAKIMTPVAGLSRVIFKHTYEIGRFDEKDDELRIRRLDELNATGASTIDAIRTRLKKLPQVENVYIKEGSHSFEVIIKGGRDHEIAHAIWHAKPAGVATTGSIECTVYDSLGEARRIRFNRPSEIVISLHANVKVKRRLNDDELNSLKNSLVDFGKKHFSLGAEIYASRFYGSLLSHPVVLDVMTLQLRDRDSGNAAPSEIKPDQIASLAFNDIHIQQIVETA